MKRILLLCAAVTFAFGASAQLPSGSIAPNFTGTDLDGNTHTLYDYLDQGYQVIIDVSAAWCGPCWTYHNSGTLETIYDEHGPDGDQTIMVFYIEGESGNTTDQLYGIQGAGSAGYTQGDWVTGTPYPIIDDASIANLYEITYFPTSFLICPSRVIIDSESIQPSQSAIMSFLNQNSCQPASENNDPSLVNYIGDQASCGDVNVAVTLINMGLNALTSCTINVTGGLSPITYNWSGNLDTYEMEEVVVGTTTISGNTTLTITITSSDDNTTNNTISAPIAQAVDSSTHIRVVINTDNWPEEVTWEILNDMGNSVANGGPYPGQDHTQITENRWVPSTGCYTFKVYDAFGDGLYGSQWGDVNGSIAVYGVDGSGNAMGSIYSYNGSYDYSEETAAANVSSVVSIVENSQVEVLNAFPNPTSDVITFNYSVKNAGNVSFEVMNMLGAKVLVQNLGVKAVGAYTQNLDLGAFGAGVYVVNINNDGNIATVRVTVK